jgi:hypothetical protein
MTDELTIRTSETGWLAQLALAYREEREVLVVDDAEIGLDPRSQSLLAMGKEYGLARREWAGVLVSLGLSGVGLWMVSAAIISPEPTSKLWLLVGGGSVLLITGGHQAVGILTHRKPPVVEITRLGFRISWE